MHYETALLPIDEDGGFLLAVHHGQHKVGGEDTRETHYASFRVGHVDRPGELRDITALCTLPRKPSKEAADYQKNMAAGQGQLARASEYGKAMKEMYAQNEVAMQHSAELALTDGIRVPRRVLASRVGHVLLGFEPSIPVGGESLPGVLRMVDAVRGTLVGEHSSSRAPTAFFGKMLQRWSSVRLGRPLALSEDGSRVLLPPDPDSNPGPALANECRFDKLSEIGKVPALLTMATWRDAWALLEHQSIKLFGPGGTLQGEFALKGQALTWAAAFSRNSEWMAVPALGGAIFVASRNGGQPRRFNPHRGLGKDAFLRVSLSDCGRWMASRADREVMVTCLAEGTSWQVAVLEDRVHEDTSHGGFVVRSTVPAAFAFVGSRLLVAQDSSVREVPFETVEGDRFVSEQGREGARKPIQASPGAAFEKMMQSARLQGVADRIRPHHSPATRMKTKPLKKAGWLLPPDPKAPPVGTSRFGGWPDLPRDAAWPEWQGRPMAFIGQLNIAEARAVTPGLRLPDSGLLSFFLGCSEQTYEKDGDPRPRYMADVMLGTEPETRGAWRVIYSPENVELGRRVYRKAPSPESFDPCSVRFVKGGQPLPDEHTAVYGLLPLDRAQRDDYNELVGQLAADEDGITDQLMGHPNLLQSTPPELMCELATRGMNPWKFPEASSTEYAALAETASEWGLLLQITSNPHANFCWGDAGHFYFYGHRAAMEAGDFSGVWVNFEN